MTAAPCHKQRQGRLAVALVIRVRCEMVEVEVTDLTLAVSAWV